jgi:hypothetical protein
MYRIDASTLYEYQNLTEQESYTELQPAIKRLRERSKKRDLEGIKKKKIYKVSSSEANQGAVFELVPHQIRMLEELQLDMEWWLLSVQDTAKKHRFNELTRKIVNFIYGRNPLKQPVEFTADDAQFYEETVREYSVPFMQRLQRGDTVIVHDPHALPLILFVRSKFTSAEVACIWRCHSGFEGQTDETRAVWDFLKKYIVKYELTIFLQQEYAQPWCPNVRILTNTIHPTSERNRNLSIGEVRDILLQAGLVKDCGQWPLQESFQDVARVYYDPVLAKRALKESAEEEVTALSSKGADQKGGYIKLDRGNSILDGPNSQYVVLRDDQGCPDFGLLERPYFLQFGHWDSLKGFTELLDAFTLLKSSPETYIDVQNSQQVRFLKNLALVLAGPQPKQDDVEAKALLSELIARIQAKS